MKSFQKENGGCNVLGRLFENENFIAILVVVPADVETPKIITLDKNGNRIDSYLVFKNVQGDMGFYSWNFGKIFPDMKIQYIDSTLTRKINPEGTNEIPGTDSLSIKRSIYEITIDGKFAEIK